MLQQKCLWFFFISSSHWRIAKGLALRCCFDCSAVFGNGNEPILTFTFENKAACMKKAGSELRLCFFLRFLQEPSSFTLEKNEDGKVKMETGKGKCPFEPSQHYTAVMAGGFLWTLLKTWSETNIVKNSLLFVCFVCLDGVLYTAATSNFLGTLFDISRATGPEQGRIRTEQSINWLSGETRIRKFPFSHKHTLPSPQIRCLFPLVSI